MGARAVRHLGSRDCRHAKPPHEGRPGRARRHRPRSAGGPSAAPCVGSHSSSPPCCSCPRCRFPIGDSGPHPGLLFAALGLFAGVLWLAEWRIVPTRIERRIRHAFRRIAGQRGARRCLFRRRCRGGQRGARPALRHLDLHLLLWRLRAGPSGGRHAQRTIALCGGRRGGPLRLHRFLFPVSRARGLRAAVRLAGFRRLSPRARTLL